MLFANGEESLQLDIVNYEFPDGQGVEDRNWLVMRGTWRREDGSVRKDSACCLMTFELQELTAGLKVLRAGIRPSYSCDFVEPYFTLNAFARGENAFTVDVSFCLLNSMDGDDTAEISCEMDTEALKALTAELDGLCARFPPRE